MRNEELADATASQAPQTDSAVLSEPTVAEIAEPDAETSTPTDITDIPSVADAGQFEAAVAIDNPVFDEPAEAAPLMPDSVQWYAFWSPFRSEIAANGFVEQLQRVTGLDYRVVKIKPGVYEVAFGYCGRRTTFPLNLSQISAADRPRHAGKLDAGADSEKTWHHVLFGSMLTAVCAATADGRIGNRGPGRRNGSATSRRSPQSGTAIHGFHIRDLLQGSRTRIRSSRRRCCLQLPAAKVTLNRQHAQKPMRTWCHADTLARDCTTSPAFIGSASSMIPAPILMQAHATSGKCWIATTAIFTWRSPPTNYGPQRIAIDGTDIPSGANWYSGYIHRHLKYVLGSGSAELPVRWRCAVLRRRPVNARHLWRALSGRSFYRAARSAGATD